MGMISKLLGLKVAQKVIHKLEERGARKDAEVYGRQQYIPAGQAPVPARGGNAIVQRAGGFYHRNPKLVASIATVLLAGVAATLAKKRGLY